MSVPTSPIPGRDGGKRGKDRDRFDPVEVVRARFLGDRQAVRHEQEIELPLFGKLSLPGIEGKARAGVDVPIGVPPVIPGAAYAMKNETKLQLAGLDIDRFLNSSAPEVLLALRRNERELLIS